MGAGGHGAVVADILQCMRRAGQDVEPIGFVDDNPGSTTAHGLPVLGQPSRIAAVSHDALVIAVGNNRTRKRIFETWRERGERFVAAVHPSAVIAADVTIGEGSMICAGAIVNPGTIIGSNVIVNTAASLDHHNVVADHVHIAPGVHTGGEVRIAEGALVGIGAIVAPQRRVGAWALVGAGAVVVRDVAPEITVVGVPATASRRPVE